MPSMKPSDGLTRIIIALSGVENEIQIADHRKRMAAISFAFFSTVFMTLLIGETFFATLMFSIISVEILGKVVSGAAFALMVPTVIFATHVKIHYEADHFVETFFKKASAVGIIFLVVGMSLMVGFSAWQAAQDAVSVIDSGPTGILGSRAVNEPDHASSGISSWIGAIPNGLLFLGLSFGMIITIYFASFCLGRAMQAFNILTQMPSVSKEVRACIKSIRPEIAALRALKNDDDAARWKLPYDLKHKFAREAFNASWKVLQGKLNAARRKFDTERLNDPLLATFHDPGVDSIPNRFADEESFCRHMADQMDQMRIHNVLRIRTGVPERGDDE